MSCSVYELDSPVYSFSLELIIYSLCVLGNLGLLLLLHIRDLNNLNQHSDYLITHLVHIA